MSSTVAPEAAENSKKYWESLVRSKYGPKEVDDFYVKWAERYDDDVKNLESKGQRRLAERLASYVPDEQRPNLKILDVAAGTGLVGVWLHALGFRTMDAVDMSRPMLDKLEKKGMYQKVICSLVGGGNRLTEIPDNTYDAVVISGGFAQSHMPVDAIREVARVLKPGGLYCNNMTEYYLRSVESLHDLEPLMRRMEEEGVWRMISREIEPNVLGGKDGLFHVFRKN